MSILVYPSSKILPAGSIHTQFKGRGFWQVLDSHGDVVKEAKDWVPNMMLNFGMMSLVPGYSSYAMMAAIFRNAEAGTGSDANWVDSGSTTAAQSGNIVTASGGFFAATDADDVPYWNKASWIFTDNFGGHFIKWDTGEEARIIGYTSPTQVTVADSKTVGSGEFTLYKTGRYWLAGGTYKQTGSLVNEAGRNGGWVTDGTTLMRRTWDFAVESTPVTYYELAVDGGWAWGYAVCCARMVVPGGISLLAGQQMRFTYEMSVTQSPTVLRHVTTPDIIRGWPDSGITDAAFYEQLQCPAIMMPDPSAYYWSVTVPGISANTAGANELGASSSYYAYSWTTDDAGLPPTPYNTLGVDRGSISSSYYPLALQHDYMNFFCDKTMSLSTAQGNGYIRSAGIKNVNGGYDSQNIAHLMVFDYPQRKDNLHTLSLTWRYSWSRDLQQV